MGIRKAVYSLPIEIREELDKKLINSYFTDYQGLSDWLAEQGHEIGKSSLHRYGKDIQEKIEAIKMATEQAKAIAEASEDSENDLADAISRLAQTKVFDLLVKLEDPGEVSLPQLVKAVSDLNKSSITIKKWKEDMKTKTKAVADEVTKQAKLGGLSDGAVEQIKSRILGIAT